MLKTLAGFASMFLVMLPFLLINVKLIKIKSNSKFVKLFFVLLIVLLLAAALVGFSLYAIGKEALMGGLIAFAIYVVLIVIQLFLHTRHAKDEEPVRVEEDRYETDFSAIDSDEDLEATRIDPGLSIETEDYENFEETQTLRREELQNSEEWKKTMDDLFK